MSSLRVGSVRLLPAAEAPPQVAASLSSFQHRLQRARSSKPLAATLESSATGMPQWAQQTPTAAPGSSVNRGENMTSTFIFHDIDALREGVLQVINVRNHHDLLKVTLDAVDGFNETLAPLAVLAAKALVDH